MTPLGPNIIPMIPLGPNIIPMIPLGPSGWALILSPQTSGRHLAAPILQLLAQKKDPEATRHKNMFSKLLYYRYDVMYYRYDVMFYRYDVMYQGMM